MDEVTRNPFGGANHNSAYVPLSDLEQEAIAKLVASGRLVLETSDGVPTIRTVSYGDLRLGIEFDLDFREPPPPGRPMPFLDLRLRIQDGPVLFQERQPTPDGDGQPVQIVEGRWLRMAWDIAIHHLDPVLVKTLLPNAYGLTSRRQDRDTKDFTFAGNMRGLTRDQKALLAAISQGERKVRGLADADIRTQVDRAKRRRG